MASWTENLEGNTIRRLPQKYRERLIKNGFSISPKKSKERESFSRIRFLIERSFFCVFALSLPFRSCLTRQAEIWRQAGALAVPLVVVVLPKQERSEEEQGGTEGREFTIEGGGGGEARRRVDDSMFLFQVYFCFAFFWRRGGRSNTSRQYILRLLHSAKLYSLELGRS